MAPRQTAQDKLRELSESARFLFAKDRLATFKGFAFDKVKNAVCTSDKVANAGFYCTGKESGKCPFCLKELDFDPEDDPWYEHSSRQKDCAFVKLGKLDEGSWTVAETITLAAHSITMAKCEQQVEILKQWQKTMTTEALADKLSKTTTETKPRNVRTK